MKPAELLIVAFTLPMFGCAAKKPLPPITGPVEVRVRDENCKLLPYPYPPDSRICDQAKIIPLTLPVKK